MEKYNGCSVPQYTRYRRVSFSRKGVQRVPLLFPDDMGFDAQEPVRAFGPRGRRPLGVWPPGVRRRGARAR
jgi:hypothetical protein